MDKGSIVDHIGSLFQKQILLRLIFSYFPRDLLVSKLYQISTSIRQFFIQYFRLHSRYVRFEIDDVPKNFYQNQIFHLYSHVRRIFHSHLQV
ncbi:hypothetical protein FGO68_gene14473 [Halteria grandinella]|uniref:Maturase K n=1 Tax=Halteria grandinella TaxID=5974 RepID=A0A8J8NLK5_HALGN|nr:hypothetical protein FGO68_gene14473 [Halteria grandinella]